MSTTGSESNLDLSLSDLEDAEPLSQGTLLNQQLERERHMTSQASAETPLRRDASMNVIGVVTNNTPNKMTELLSDAGLGVNRVVAVPPSIPQNQYWMLPGAIFDE